MVRSTSLRIISSCWSTTRSRKTFWQKLPSTMWRISSSPFPPRAWRSWTEQVEGSNWLEWTGQGAMPKDIVLVASIAEVSKKLHIISDMNLTLILWDWHFLWKCILRITLWSKNSSQPILDCLEKLQCRYLMKQSKFSLKKV